MIAYVTFIKKEFYEYVRTFKLLILLSLFTFVGIVSPIIAKIMPEIVNNFLPENINISINNPTVLDSWSQFFKNTSQIGIIAIIILFSGLISNELKNGTLINLLTKGLKRSTVILSKFTMAVLLWTFSYILSFTICYGYTLNFFGRCDITNLAFSTFCLWIFGVLLIATLILGGVIFGNNYGSLFFTAGFVVLMMVTNIVPSVKLFNPAVLSSVNVAILEKQYLIHDLKYNIMVTIILISMFLISSIVIMNKKEI
ncbi:ABC transporter permease [Clostridiaceae bacterium M8S5]|nr:ABC transporter permease [Clostridiaceae bacterium M8S5]